MSLSAHGSETAVQVPRIHVLILDSGELKVKQSDIKIARCWNKNVVAPHVSANPVVASAVAWPAPAFPCVHVFLSLLAFQHNPLVARKKFHQDHLLSTSHFSAAIRRGGEVLADEQLVHPHPVTTRELD